MEDIEKQDVTGSSPEETPEVVNTEQEATPAQETQEQAEPSTQEVKPEVKDDRPIQNVAWETKRKLDEIYPVINELKEFMARPVQQEKPQYSKAQLQAYAVDPTTSAELRIWAYNEVDRIDREDRRKEYESLVRSTTEKSREEARKSQSVQWVTQTFPELTLRDNSGNFAGWNHEHPLLKRANEYLFGDPSLQKHPDGFMAAVKMAAFDLGVSVKMNDKVNKTVGQLRKEQKKQLASSGGTRTAENPDNAIKTRYEKVKAEYAKTGSQAAFAEMVKMKKLNPFV